MMEPVATVFRRYDPLPRYPPVGGRVLAGWPAVAAELPNGPTVLALEGPAICEWEACVDGLSQALAQHGRRVTRLDLRERFVAWERILERTASPELADDPNFATLAGGTLADLLESLPIAAPGGDGVLIVFGPGAAVMEHDVLWYADLPKRYAEAAISAGRARNLGQPERAGPGTSRRLFYIDWPLIDRHRDALVPRIARWIDVQDPLRPSSIDGPTLRRTVAALARRPFRTRPTFNTASWGGHWGQRVLGMNQGERNTGIGYELIAPESGVLIGANAHAQVEVPFALIVAHCPSELIGDEVHAAFGSSFPIRFDYLDTVDGGNLSVHCHPLPDYMQRVFGWSYPQHETYYVMVGGERNRIFLGLRGDVDLAAFHRDAHEASEHGRAFDVEQYVQTFAATPHRLFAIPAGTPHGSGKGNVILEVSATPYLYSLRFYDWLRSDTDGTQRPVHVEHAFANLNRGRVGAAVRDELVREPRTLSASGAGREELLAAVPQMFFDVRRLVLESAEGLPDDTRGRFHVLTVVDGEGVVIETHAGDRHDLAYAETVVVPAAVGRYRLRRIGSTRTRVVKALVR